MMHFYGTFYCVITVIFRYYTVSMHDISNCCMGKSATKYQGGVRNVTMLKGVHPIESKVIHILHDMLSAYTQTQLFFEVCMG